MLAAFLYYQIRIVNSEITVYYIRPDRSVVPPTSSILKDGNIYTITTNIVASIIVQKEDIVLDGAGHTIEGNGTGTGIDLSNIKNVTITNCIISFT